MPIKSYHIVAWNTGHSTSYRLLKHLFRVFFIHSLVTNAHRGQNHTLEIHTTLSIGSLTVKTSVLLNKKEWNASSKTASNLVDASLLSYTIFQRKNNWLFVGYTIFQRKNIDCFWLHNISNKEHWLFIGYTIFQRKNNWLFVGYTIFQRMNDCKQPYLGHEGPV